MTARQSRRKAPRAAAQRQASASIKSPAARFSQSSEDVRDYIAEMAAGLAELALASQLDSLAVACDVVREIAEGNVSAEARLVRLS